MPGNPYHDARGEFATKGNAVSPIGSASDAHTGVTAQTVKIAQSNVAHKRAIAKQQSNPRVSRARNMAAKADRWFAQKHGGGSDTGH